MRFFLPSIIFMITPLLAGAQQQSPHLTASLITNATDFSRPFTVGIWFNIEPGWYTYWKNPGDAGVPPEVRWTLPKGFKAGELAFPVPEKMESGDIVDYGYRNDVVLFVTITPPPNYVPAATDKISAKLNWLVCKESCIIESTSVYLPLVTPAPSVLYAANDLIGHFNDRLPESAGDSTVNVQSASLQNTGSGHTVTIVLNGKDASEVTDFFPETMLDFVVNYKGIVAKDGIVTIPLTPSGSSAKLTHMKGVALAGGRGIELNAPITKASIGG